MWPVEPLQVSSGDYGKGDSASLFVYPKEIDVGDKNEVMDALYAGVTQKGASQVQGFKVKKLKQLETSVSSTNIRKMLGTRLALPYLRRSRCFLLAWTSRVMDRCALTACLHDTVTFPAANDHTCSWKLPTHFFLTESRLRAPT